MENSLVWLTTSIEPILTILVFPSFVLHSKIVLLYIPSTLLAKNRLPSFDIINLLQPLDNGLVHSLESLTCLIILYVPTEQFLMNWSEVFTEIIEKSCSIQNIKFPLMPIILPNLLLGFMYTVFTTGLYSNLSSKFTSIFQLLLFVNEIL